MPDTPRPCDTHPDLVGFSEPHTSDWATDCVTLALDGAIAGALPPPDA
ncbi:hypothetical protein [Bradyrhizobium sp.]